MFSCFSVLNDRTHIFRESGYEISESEEDVARLLEARTKKSEKKPLVAGLKIDEKAPLLPKEEEIEKSCWDEYCSCCGDCSIQ